MISYLHTGSASRYNEVQIEDRRSPSFPPACITTNTLLETQEIRNTSMVTKSLTNRTSLQPSCRNIQLSSHVSAQVGGSAAPRAIVSDKRMLRLERCVVTAVTMGHSQVMESLRNEWELKHYVKIR